MVTIFARFRYHALLLPEMVTQCDPNFVDHLKLGSVIYFFIFSNSVVSFSD